MLHKPLKPNQRLTGQQSLSRLLPLIALAVLAGCAGPTTPFGTPDSNELVQVKNKTNKNVKINIDRNCKGNLNQNINSPSLSVSILDKRGIPSHAIIDFLYNGFDVSAGFVKLAQKVAKPESLVFTIPKVILKSETKGLFTVSYRSDVLAEPITETIHLFDCKTNNKSASAHIQPYFIGSLNLARLEAAR
jgi:hypothetical protein